MLAPPLGSWRPLLGEILDPPLLSEVGGAYAKSGLIGMLSNKRPDVEFKDIKLDETGESLFA